MESKITSKFQVTIPKEVRERLKLRVADAIEWKSEGDRVYVQPVSKPFLKYRGSIKTGPGDVTEDIAEARRNIGRRAG